MKKPPAATKAPASAVESGAARSARSDGSAGSAGRLRAVQDLRTDAELVAACRAGEREAFVEIVRRHQSLICAIAYNITGNVTRSEDVAQDTFVRAWRQMDELREPAKLRGWLGKIASSLALNVSVRERRMVSGDRLEEESDRGPQPDEAAADGEDAALVWKTLETLPESLRLPLILFYREGESVAAVAAALELSEDAVKQRLARGRSALRDKVEALTSSVLGRTQPGAVFTFAVLAAAGVLAAPSALAAAAFSGAAAAGTGAGAAASGSASAGTSVTSATVSKFSFFTAMTASTATPAIAAALALIFLPVGYHLSGAVPSGSLRPGSAAMNHQTPQASGLPDLNTSALVAEWRRLHAEHGSTPEAMPALFDAINSGKDAFRRKALLSGLVAEWTALDPQGALEFFRNNKPAELPVQVMREWMSFDASSAVKALMASGSGWEQYARPVLSQIARSTPELLEDVIRAFAPPENQSITYIRDACRIAAERDPESAARAAVKLTGRVTESNQVEMLAGAAAAWAGKDPQAAWTWANSLEGAARKLVAQQEVLKSWAGQDPVGALEHTNQVPGDPRVSNWDLGYQVVRSAAEKDFDLTAKWLTENPAKLGPASAGGLRDKLAEKLQADFTGTLERAAHEPALAKALNSGVIIDSFGRAEEMRQWLRTQPESDFVSGLKRSLFSAAAWNNVPKLQSWVREMPPAERTPEFLKPLAGDMMTLGLQGMEDILAQSVPELKAALIRTSFQQFEEMKAPDPQLWAERLDQVPAGAEREEATRKLAAKWGAADPQTAVEWAESLADEKVRLSGISAATGSWADADSFEASQWVGSLPPGAERDAAAKALVSTIASSNPDSAMAWAKSINGEDLRLQATGEALKSWALQDLEGALRELETAPLSREQKETLRSALETAAAGGGVTGNH